MSTHCLFCSVGLSSNRAKEHIFSQELLKEFGIIKDITEHCHWQTHSEDGFNGGLISVTESERKLSFKSFVAGSFCNKCNNGWMNQLEIKTRPTIYELMKGNMLVKDIKPEMYELIGAWIFKTGVVLQSVVNNPFTIPRRHIEYLFNNTKAPLDIGIFASNTKEFKTMINWSFSPFWIAKRASGEGISGQDYRNSYKIFFQLGKLVLIICYYDNTTRLYTYNQKKQIPIISNNLIIPQENDTITNDVFSQFKGMPEICDSGVMLYDLETLSNTKIGVNTFCPCGSRQKFKKCHGRK